ncbi:MAG: hypothetical protein HKN26_07215 [Acidimicrobiales bacterium]|nr:hypothetical protein [Acidimicrobiales bacterium]
MSDTPMMQFVDVSPMGRLMASPAPTAPRPAPPSSSTPPRPDRRSGFDGRILVRMFMPVLVVWAIGLVVLAGLVTQNAVPHEQLLLDPNYTGGLPWYTGLVSNLMILVWAVATTAAAGAAFVVRRAGRPQAEAFLRGATLLSLLLTLDDALQLHIVVAKTLDVPKPATYVAYLALSAAWALRSWPELQRTRWQLLAAAAGAFAVSLIVDQLTSPDNTTALIFEDGAKTLGVLAWATYFVVTARDIAASVIPDVAAEPADRSGLSG